LDVLHTTTAPRPRQAAMRPTRSGWRQAGAVSHEEAMAELPG